MVAARVGTNVATHAKPMPTLGASRVGTVVATHARLMPTLVAARVGTILALVGQMLDPGRGIDYCKHL